MTLAQNNDSIAVDSAKVIKPEITNPHYIDEVVWVVGDEAILRSDIEIARMQAEQEGIKWDGDPDCRIPESIAVQKLFINQAALDSIVVTESEISQAIDQQINGWIQMIGSKERLEEYGLTESQYEQVLKDCADKIEGNNDYDWAEIVDKYGINIHRDSLRKAQQTIFGGAFVKTYFESKKVDNSATSLDDKITELRRNV